MRGEHTQSLGIAWATGTASLSNAYSVTEDLNATTPGPASVVLMRLC